ncbi:hypothetical protein DFQ29_010058, partial [Apophysomyces sp. BC1021]
MEISDGYTSDNSDMEIANSDDELNDIYASGDAFTPNAFGTEPQSSPMLSTAKQVKNMAASPNAPNNGNNKTAVVRVSTMFSNKPLLENLPVSYVIDLSEDSSSDNELIEDLYGPFDSYKTPPSETMFVASPRPSPAPRKHLASREKEIELLKKLIAQKEEERKKLQARQSASPSLPPLAPSKPPSTVVVTPTKDVLPASPAPPAIQTPHIKAQTKVVETAKIDNSEAELRRSLNAMIEEMDHEKATGIITSELDTPTEDADIGDAFDTSAVDNIPDTEMSVDSPIAFNGYHFEDHDDGYSSDESFVTASSSVTSDTGDDSQTSNESKEVQMQIDELERQIAGYNSELDKIKKSRHAIEVKVLGLQVRISIEKNRKAHLKRPSSGPKEDARIVYHDKRSLPSDVTFISQPNKRRREPHPVASLEELEDGQLQPEDRRSEGVVRRESRDAAPQTQPQEPKMPSRASKPFPEPASAQYFPTFPMPQTFMPSAPIPQARAPPPSSPPPLPPPPPPPPPPQLAAAPVLSTPPTLPALSSSRYQTHPATHATPKSAFFHTTPKAHRLHTSPSSSLSSPAPSRELPSTSNVTPIVDGMKLSTYLIDLEELIKVRLGSDQKTTLMTPTHRSPPRPARIITVDGFTLTLDSVLLERAVAEPVQQANMRDQNASALPVMTPNPLADILGSTPFLLNQLSSQAYSSSQILSAESEDDSADVFFESPLLNALQRDEASLLNRKMEVKPFVNRILQSLPAGIAQDLVTNDIQIRPDLEPAKDLVIDAVRAHPGVELLWALYAELSLHCHGNNEIFCKDIESILEHVPLALDVHWQRLRVARDASDREALRNDLLALIARHKTAEKSPGLVTISGMTTEILLRMLRNEGLSVVVQLLTGNENAINLEEVEPFSLEDTPNHIQLVDDDLYVLWMTILYFFLCQRMPDTICRNWYSTLLTSGRPSVTKLKFTIDWSSVATEAPLSRSEQLGVVNMLLSMLRYFSKKARGNDAKRPLLMSVLRTLLDFLSHIECYKRAGTLALLRGAFDMEALRPEVYDIAAVLQTKMGDRTGALNGLKSHAQRLSMNHKLILAYRSAHLLQPSEKSSHEELREAALLLKLPLKDVYDMQGASTDTDNVQVDLVRRMYLIALGMDFMLPLQAKRSFNAKEFRNSAFAWINLIFLTQISRWIYQDPILQSTLLQQLKMARDFGINAVDSEDAK